MAKILHASGRNGGDAKPDRAVPLVLDIDGTLLRTDLLMETFWAAMRRNPLAGIAVFLSSFLSPAHLKRRLLQIAQPDIDLMPVNAPMLQRAHDAHDRGQTVHLASGADQVQVDAVARRFGFPGEHFGSNDPHNLTGAVKAELLLERFGERGFDYAGNARIDLNIWQHARIVLAVEPRPWLAKRLKLLERPVVIVPDPHDPWAFMRELRPRHWIKNLLLLLPMVAAHTFDSAAILRVLTAIAAFSLGASALYIVNDLLDLDADRRHPEKCHRPIASGTLPIWEAMLLCAGLLVAAPVLAWQAGPVVAALTILYMLSSLTYSLWLKRLVWIDLAMLAWMFLLRVMTGAAALQAETSVSLPAFVFATALSLAAVKRITGLARAHHHGHLPGRGYDRTHLAKLEIIATLAAGAAIAILLAYAFGSTAATLYSAPAILALAVIPLFLWFFRIIRLSARGQEDYDPTVFVTHDRIGLALVASGIGLALLAI